MGSYNILFNNPKGIWNIRTKESGIHLYIKMECGRNQNIIQLGGNGTILIHRYTYIMHYTMVIVCTYFKVCM